MSNKNQVSIYRINSNHDDFEGCCSSTEIINKILLNFDDKENSKRLKNSSYSIKRYDSLNLNNKNVEGLELRVYFIRLEICHCLQLPTDFINEAFI